MLSPNARRTAPYRFVIAAVFGFALSVFAGCNSIYHRTGEELSQGSDSRLELRIREARAAAASSAAVIDQAGPESADLRDRAESYSWEFSKAVASVHDVAARLNTRSEPLAALLTALDRADKDFADAVDPDQAQGNALRPAMSLAAESLKAAIAQADSYLGQRATVAKPKQV